MEVCEALGRGAERGTADPAHQEPGRGRGAARRIGSESGRQPVAGGIRRRTGESLPRLG